MLKIHAMARTTVLDPLQKYKFRVTSSGLPSGMGFQKVSGLSREVGVVEYTEGGFAHVHKLAGKEKVGEISLETGQFANKDLETAYKNCLSSPAYRTTLTIEQMDKFDVVKRTWTLNEAWVSKWEASDLDSSSEDAAIEKITVQFENFLD